jgi:hypothetical protein
MWKSALSHVGRLPSGSRAAAAPRVPQKLTESLQIPLQAWLFAAYVSQEPLQDDTSRRIGLGKAIRHPVPISGGGHEVSKAQPGQVPGNQRFGKSQDTL